MKGGLRLTADASYRRLTGLLPPAQTILAMPRIPEQEPVPSAYRGEVWTDGQGRAVVVLPAGAESLPGPVAYTLQACEVSVSATVISELRGGQFTIETDEPHVKVAWRIDSRIDTVEAAISRDTATQSGEES